MSSSNTPRGIALAGNWIVDHIKMVNVWPSQGSLAEILGEEMGTGGSPFNLMIDIGLLDPDLPMDAYGLVGDDDDGRWIIETIKPYARDVSGLKIEAGATTSYTDVMTVEETGNRSFFHLIGANAVFDVDHVDVDKINTKIFHIGYLLLMPTMDSEDKEYGTRAARLLAKCKEKGLITSIDMVSAEGGRFAQIVTPILKYTDYCICNEVEAAGVTGLQLRDENDQPMWDAIEKATKAIAEKGAGLNVTIHLPEGATSLDVVNGKTVHVSSLKLPKGHIKGAAGAGDAFCAGMLYGLHEEWELERSISLGHACAAANLTSPTCTGGMRNMEETLALSKELS